MTDNFARLLALTGGNGGSGGTTDYETLNNKPSIGGTTLIGDLTLAELGIIVDDQLNLQSTNPVQNAVLTALLNAFPYSNVTGKPQINGVTLTGNITLDELGLNAIWVGTQAEYAAVESTLAEGTLVIITDDQDVDNVPTQNSTNLVTSGGVYAFVVSNTLPASTKYAANATFSMNGNSFVCTLTLKDQNGDTIGTPQSIDLPLETMVIGGSYDDTTKKIILTLKNGQTVEFSVADLVAGLQTEITASNKLSADLVDDSSTTNKFVSAVEKSSIGTSATKLTGISESASNYIELANGLRFYVSSTEPTDTDIPDGSIGVGWSNGV